MAGSIVQTSEMGIDPNTWIDAHSDYLFQFAWKRLRRRELAEDLVQETLLAAWDGRENYQGRASERSWLTAILKNKIADLLRKNIRESITSLTDLNPDASLNDLFTKRGYWKVTPTDWNRDDPAATIQRHEFWQTFDSCLGALPQRLRDVFVDRHIDERPTEEICQANDITATNCWVMLHRARLRMWRCLSINWFELPPPEDRG